MMKTSKRAWQALWAAAAVFTSGWAWAAPTVENVTGSLQGGQEVVRIEFSEPLNTLPTGFVTQAPARIALDVVGASNGMGRNAVEMNVGNLRSVNVVQAGDRSRVVLNLKTPTNYKLALDGKALVVALDPVAQTAAAVNQPSHFAESNSREMQPLKDLDFRRGPDGSGRVIVDLPTNQVGVDIRQQGQTLVVDFLKSSLPEGLRRRMDVTDFGTPIQTVTTTQQGDRVHMVIEPRGAWEHSAYQSDTQFVVEVRQQKQDPSKLTQGPGYSGEKLSLNFQNIEVRSLLQVIADFTNFNIVTSDSVTGAVTLRLKDVPWDQALDIILQAKGLGMRRTGNVLWIAPKDEIAAKEKLELEANAAIQTLEPLRTQAFQLNYTKAADVAVQITGAGASRILSARGSAIAEPRTNQLFVTDVPSRLEQVQAMIAKVDIAVPQVLIEARIVEADDNFGKQLGVKLGAGFPSFGVGGGGRGVIAPTFGDAASNTTNSGPRATSSPFVNLPAAGVNGFSPGTLGLSIFNSSASRFLNLEISALEADNKGRTISSPRVVTADKTKALIEQGTEIPYQQATSSGATSVSFRQATLKLEVTPQITPEGSIILELDINNDTVGDTTAAGPSINTKHIKTQVLVENGGTVVIGGIFTLTDTDQDTHVPVLGDIPGVGNLFKNRAKTSRKTEMLVFITPKMLTERLGSR